MAEFIAGAGTMLVGVFMGYVISYASAKQANTHEYVLGTTEKYTPVKEMLQEES